MKHKTMYYGGPIFTCNLRDDMAESLLTQDDKILYVGDYRDILRQTDADTEFLDIGGRAICPTFVDGMQDIFFPKPPSDLSFSSWDEGAALRNLRRGISTICEAGEEGAKGISALQKLSKTRDFPLRFVEMIGNAKGEIEGSLATCLSACGIETGLGNSRFSLGTVRVFAGEKTKSAYAPSSDFALFLSHLLTCGLSVQIEPENEFSARESALCLAQIMKASPPLYPCRMLLGFNVDNSTLSALRCSRVSVVTTGEALLSSAVSSAMLDAFVKAGIPLSFSFGECSPFEVLATAFCGHDKTSSPSLLEVLRMATLGGAQALGLSSELGSLEWGKQADLMVLSCLPEECSPSAFAQAYPTRVVVGGKVVYSKDKASTQSPIL